MKQDNSWVVGHHAANAVLATNPERILELYIVENHKNDVQQKILKLASQHQITAHRVNKHELTKRCGSDKHQGVALYVKAKQEQNEKALAGFVQALEQPLILILDQVQDPHNFGACLRTADAAGVDAVIVAKDNASPMTAVVRKVASGAAETMPVFRVSNLSRAIDKLKDMGVWLIGTSDKAEATLYQQDLRGALAIVMGAEAKGLRKLTEQKCDVLVKLPMAGSVVSSLNVSVASGICLYEAVRQRISCPNV